MKKIIITLALLIAPFAADAGEHRFIMDCGQTANVARQAMTDRQYGNSLAMSLDLHHAGNAPIVREAYSEPMAKDADGRLAAIAAFQGKWHSRCVNRKNR